ncbi:hypothetical protein, partial [Salmonella sp. s51884]
RAVTVVKYRTGRRATNEETTTRRVGKGVTEEDAIVPADQEHKKMERHRKVKLRVMVRAHAVAVVHTGAAIVIADLVREKRTKRTGKRAVTKARVTRKDTNQDTAAVDHVVPLKRREETIRRGQVKKTLHQPPRFL